MHPPERDNYCGATSKSTVFEFSPAVRTKTCAKPANIRSTSVTVTNSWLEFTNIVCWATPFHTTRASVPKFAPFTVMAKGALFTGTVLGCNVVSEGGVKTVPKWGPWLLLTGSAPHPNVNTITRKIEASLIVFLQNPLLRAILSTP